MTNLAKLKVSLTKHGAHKIAPLLQKYSRKSVLRHLWGSEPGIKIDEPQALKNLSVDAKGVVPQVWDDARALGVDAINGLVLIAIISSHQKLIDALKQGRSSRRYKGRIVKGVVLGGKAFTNFKHTVVELGYGLNDDKDQFDYDFTNLFKIPGLNGLAAQLLATKLKAAMWDEKNSLEDELIALDFHAAFSIDEASFRAWITSGAAAPVTSLTTEDEEFFEAADEKVAVFPFKFKKGHNPKKTGTVKVGQTKTDVEASLLHNEMQTKLFEQLVATHGANHVGTENSSGSGTAIDVVVQTPTFRWFYEIKTAPSAKACIRQAIAQLLEYAYWQCDASRTSKMIIVGPKPITKSAEKYLEFLRDTFKLELYYEQCAV